MSLFAILLSASTAAATPPKPVATLDLGRYVGRWYEIARYPNWFQKKCARDVIAEYALRPDGRITVTNRCVREDGSADEAVGVARLASAGSPASQLKVRFAPAFLSFIPQVWGDYWVLALAPDYRYAVVGDPGRSYLWILSRTAAMTDADYRAAVDAAAAQGFDPSRLVRTRQSPREPWNPAEP